MNGKNGGLPKLSDDVAIHLDRVTKDYRRGSVASTGLKAAVLHLPAYLERVRRHKAKRVLTDVSLDIRRGECFGVIGLNGSGKSTLLGMIAGVLRPNSGTVTTRGRVCPLLQLGAGFHMELSGRENIMLNGVLLGMTRREVADRRASIIEFSELGDMIHEPARTYSSGMLARLGFSIAVHVEPDILLVDEVLAVGDGAFQAKCLAKFREFHASGVTSVLVSHDQATIEQICDRVGLIHACELAAVGSASEVLPVYREILSTASPDRAVPQFSRRWS
jgi:lipopolysaccharide transport system ATP-binding protein